MSADSGPTRSIAPSATPERVLRRLEWRVIRRLDGRLQGDYRTLFHGVGIDFGLGEIKVTFEDLISAFVGSLLCIVAWRLIRKFAGQKKQDAEQLR